MSVNHEAVAALPVSTAADKSLIRAMCTRRFTYVLDASESATNFVAADPATGVVTRMLFQNNASFLYDSTDSTTAHDGVTCLVSSDGKRFKSGTIAPPFSVLDKDLVAQPGGPAVGARYLIPTAATGTDWAGQDGKIGIYTAAGWRFAISPIGRFLYVEDETAFYHRNPSGVWIAGVGSVSIGANSVTLQNVLGANASFVIKVENQTTNTPPGSPTAPTAYIIGPSPTGAWAGNVGKLAICLVNGSFTIIAAVAGDTVYDKALGNSYRYSGTAWEASIGAWIKFRSTATQGVGSNSVGTSGTYAYSSGTPPTTVQLAIEDNVPLTHTALSATAKLFLSWSAVLNAGTVPGQYVVALFKDAGTNAIEWDAVGLPTSNCRIAVRFGIQAGDTLSHVYKIRVIYTGGNTPLSFTHSRFELEEASQ